MSAGPDGPERVVLSQSVQPVNNKKKNASKSLQEFCRDIVRGHTTELNCDLQSKYVITETPNQIILFPISSRGNTHKRKS